MTAAVCFAAATAMAQGKPTDPQIADIAYTAGQIDIEQAIDALKKTQNKAVRAFAEEMIWDHLAVNNKILTLCDKLKVTPESNETSTTMYHNASRKREELRALSGTAFDKAYAENEVAYHEAVIGALEFDADTRRAERAAQELAGNRPQALQGASKACREARGRAEAGCDADRAPKMCAQRRA